jgi:hypothetical protein
MKANRESQPTCQRVGVSWIALFGMFYSRVLRTDSNGTNLRAF